MPKPHTLGIVMPSEVVSDLDELADMLGVSRSEVIRRACSVYLWQTRVVREDLRNGTGGVWRRIFGPPVAKVDPETDELFAAAFRSLAARASRDIKDGASLA